MIEEIIKEIRKYTEKEIKYLLETNQGLIIYLNEEEEIMVEQTYIF